MPVITSRGRHLPGYRIETGTIREHVSGGTNGVRTKSVQAPDDDALTLALAAARAVGADEAPLDEIHFATTTPAYAYGSVTPLLVESLGLGASTAVRTHRDSDRAGVTALGAAADAAAARGETALTVAADAPAPAQGTDREKTAGAGAAAVLVKPGDNGLAVVGHGTCTRDLLESWQAPTDSDRHDADDRFARDVGYVESHVRAVERALDDAGWVPENVDALALNQPNPRFPGRVAGAVGVPDDALAAPSLARECGDLCSASPLASLAGADVAADDRVVVAGFGAGVADAVCLRANGTPPAPAPDPGEGTELDYVEYLQHIGHLE